MQQLHEVRAGGLSGSRSPSRSLAFVVAGCGSSNDNNEQQLVASTSRPRRTSTPAAAAPADAPDPQPAVAPRSGGSGTPIKIAIMSECKGAFGSFDNQNMAGAVVGAVRSSPGPSRRTRTSRRDGFTGGAIGDHPLKLVGVGCGDDTLRHGHQGDAAADGAARRRRHDRPALGRRVDRGRQLRQAAPGQDVRRRLRGRAGHDAQGAGAELLPLQRRRRAVERRPRRHRLQQARVAQGRGRRPTTTASAGRRRPASSRSSARRAARSPSGSSRR